MKIRFANVTRLAQVSTMAAVLTAASWTFGSASAQAAPQPAPHPDKIHALRSAAQANADDPPYRGTIIKKWGIPVAFIRPGVDDQGHVIAILVECQAHQKKAETTHEGFRIIHC
jgi:hypothetical protein